MTHSLFWTEPLTFNTHFQLHIYNCHLSSPTQKTRFQSPPILSSSTFSSIAINYLYSSPFRSMPYNFVHFSRWQFQMSFSSTCISHKGFWHVKRIAVFSTARVCPIASTVAVRQHIQEAPIFLITSSAHPKLVLACCNIIFWISVIVSSDNDSFGSHTHA